MLLEEGCEGIHAVFLDGRLEGEPPSRTDVFVNGDLEAPHTRGATELHGEHLLTRGAGEDQFSPRIIPADRLKSLFRSIFVYPLPLSSDVLDYLIWTLFSGNTTISSHHPEECIGTLLIFIRAVIIPCPLGLKREAVVGK